MCFYSRIAYFCSNIVYIVEKLISYCAFASVVTCIMATMTITLALGIGLGYNYCFIDLTTGKLVNDTKWVILTTKTKTLKPKTRTTTGPVTKITTETITEQTTLTDTSHVLETVPDIARKTVAVTVQKFKTALQKAALGKKKFGIPPETVTFTTQELAKSSEREQETVAVNAQELEKSLETADTTQKLESVPEIVPDDVKELGIDLKTEDIKIIQGLGIDSETRDTIQELEITPKTVIDYIKELGIVLETEANAIQGLGIDSNTKDRIQELEPTPETVSNSAQELETVEDSTRKLKSILELEITTDIPHSLNRRSRTIIVPIRHANFTSLITRLKNLKYNLTLEIFT